MHLISEPGDKTSKDVKPDFESGRGYYWMKQVKARKQFGSNVPIPRKPRTGLAENSFFDQVDRKLSRSSSVVNVRFDSQGKRIHE